MTTIQHIEETWAGLPRSTRRRVAIVVAVLAIFVATAIASSRLLRLVFQELDLLAYAGLFATCWIGAGGALVPIPGVRAVSWLMIVQQGAALEPVIVAVVAAVAMTLGQTSYFVATRAATRRAQARQPDTTNVDAEPNSEPDESRRRRSMARARSGIQRQIRRRGAATVFLVCALPTPLTTLTTTSAAASGMTYLRFMPAAFGGFAALSTVLVLFGQGLMQAIRPLFGL